MNIVDWDFGWGVGSRIVRGVGDEVDSGGSDKVREVVEL